MLAWIWLFEAAPLAATARFTDAGGNAMTVIPRCCAARQITPRACAIWMAARGNLYSL